PLEVTAQRLERGSRGHTLRAATDTDTHVNATLISGRIDATGGVAVENQSSASTRGTDVIDQLFVTWAVEHSHAQVRDILTECLRQRAQVLADRLANVDHANALGASRDLVHVEDRRGVQHRTAVRNRDHRDRVLPPGSGE